MGSLLAAIATVWFVWAGLAPTAQAQSSLAAAEILFNEGRELMDAGDFAAACEKFSASHDLDPSVGALLNLGDCREKNREITSAWLAYRQAAAMARRDNDRRRLRFAEERARTLEPRLSYVVIDVPPESRVEDLTIELDGELISETLWGQRVPANVGERVLKISASGRVTETLTVPISSEAETVDVAIPVLEEILAPELERRAPPEPVEPVRTPEPSPPVTQPAPALDSNAPIQSDRGGGLSGGRIAAIGSGIVGAAGIATGVIFALRSQDKWDKAQPFCNELNQCSQQGLDFAQQANDAATVSNVSYAAGAILIAGGVALWLLSSPDSIGSEQQRANRDSQPSPRRVTVTPVLGPEQAGFTISGSF